MQTALHAREPPTDDRLRLRTVYREHARYVWRVCHGMGVSPLHIDDVVHDVFLVVRRRLDDFDPRRSMRAWLAGITRRVVSEWCTRGMTTFGSSWLMRRKTSAISASRA